MSKILKTKGLSWVDNGDVPVALELANDFSDVEKGVFVLNDVLATLDRGVLVVYLSAGKRFEPYTSSVPFTVSLIEGQLLQPHNERPMQVYETQFFTKTVIIEAKTDSIIAIQQVYHPLETAIREELINRQQWKQLSPVAWRSNPKVSIESPTGATINLNFWYISPHAVGGIHNHAESNDHNIIERYLREVHILCAGNGSMVKYTPDKKKEIERWDMQLNQTHPAFFKELPNGMTEYPQHAWVAGDKGSLFIAIEYFPKT